MNVAAKPSRRSLRFTDNQSLHAEIDFDVTVKPFQVDLPAIICNESFRGCCIVTVKNDRLSSGSRLRIKVGDLTPMLGEVKWVSDIDPEVMKIGIQFLE